MSSMQFACPFCANLFEVDVEYIGQHVACPTCAGVVLIPEAHPLGESVPLGPAPPPFIQEQPEVPPLIHHKPAPTSEPKISVPASDSPFDLEREAARLASTRKRAPQSSTSHLLWNAFWIIMALVLLVLMGVILMRSH